VNGSRGAAVRAAAPRSRGRHDLRHELSDSDDVRRV
jgi:hypothetical protein